MTKSSSLDRKYGDSREAIKDEFIKGILQKSVKVIDAQDIALEKTERKLAITYPNGKQFTVKHTKRFSALQNVSEFTIGIYFF